jgi:hypothetical protein
MSGHFSMTTTGNVFFQVVSYNVMCRPGLGNVRLPEAELDLELQGLREEGAVQLRARHLR